jgi:hypothetical protein
VCALPRTPRLAVVPDQIDFALHPARHVISRHKHIAVPPQIPTRIGLAPNASCGAAIFRQRASARAQDRLLVRRRRRRANLPATLTARSRIQAQTKQACDAPRASIIAELSTCKVNKNNDDRRSRSATGFASNFSLTSFLLRGCSLPGSSPRSRPAPRR